MLSAQQQFIKYTQQGTEGDPSRGSALQAKPRLVHEEVTDILSSWPPVSRELLPPTSHLLGVGLFALFCFCKLNICIKRLWSTRGSHQFMTIQRIPMGSFNQEIDTVRREYCSSGRCNVKGGRSGHIF